MRTRSLWVGLVVALGAGWFGWHYLQFRNCGDEFCAPRGGQPGIRLASGEELPVLSTHLGDSGRLVVDYLTRRDRDDLGALCDEAKEVWKSVSATLDTRRMTRVTLGPTSPESEFLGMKYLVVPLYTCCVSTHLTVEKDPTGEWSFPQCRAGR
jgi:hypothetical protein